MLDQRTVVYSTKNSKLQTVDVNLLLEKLKSDGHCLLRGYQTGLDQFSDLINGMCTEVTYDPARALSADSVQKVDAGVAEIGLHIENGNTPRVPHVLGFYSRSAARHGSQTTVCDGQMLWAEMPAELKELFAGKLICTRTLSEVQWKSYLAQEHPALQSPEQVTEQHLVEMLRLHKDHSATINADGSIDYSLLTDAVRTSPLSDQSAFANTLLGPSFNYDAPRFYFESGQEISAEIILQLREYCELHTVEINWQDNDVLFLDNWRVMHGRRAIMDAVNRELFIGMGMIQ